METDDCNPARYTGHQDKKEIVDWSCAGLNSVIDSIHAWSARGPRFKYWSTQFLKMLLEMSMLYR